LGEKIAASVYFLVSVLCYLKLAALLEPPHLLRIDRLQIAFGYLLRDRFSHLVGLHQEMLRLHSKEHLLLARSLWLFTARSLLAPEGVA
jgi:hypothetical protein